MKVDDSHLVDHCRQPARKQNNMIHVKATNADRQTQTKQYDTCKDPKGYSVVCTVSRHCLPELFGVGWCPDEGGVPLYNAPSWVLFGVVQWLMPACINTTVPGRRRGCHFASMPTPSLLQSLLKVEGGCSRMAVSPTAICSGRPGDLDWRAVTDERDAVGVGVGLPQRVPDADPPLDPLPVAQPLLQLAIDVTVI